MTDTGKIKNQANRVGVGRRFYNYLAVRPYNVILLAALLYNISYKFLWANRLDMVAGFWRWILTDIAFVLGIEIVFAIVCFLWPRRWVIRTITFAAALICTWSVINAAWLRRTGTQVLPGVLLPLFRSPVNGFAIVGVNLAKMPASAVILLGCAAVLLIFFFSVMAKPTLPKYNLKFFIPRIILSCVIVLAATYGRFVTKQYRPSRMVAAGLQSNCQLRGLVSLFASKSGRLTRKDLAQAERTIPRFDEISVEVQPDKFTGNNLVIIILEGVQWQYTSLGDERADRTPFIASMADESIELTNARSALTHTTKALFALLTGRYPNYSQDIAEAVPESKPYVSLATILKKLNYRTAFFQSAKGNFECRPGLAHNLGFEKFCPREGIADANAFIGYLGCDEFAMLKPIIDWIDADKQRPFFLAFMCSITHDPYEVPEWFEEPAKEATDRYFQAIRYTDKFIAALDVELAKRNLSDNTVFCVVSDHGEAFEEHGLWGHERIAYDEVLRVPAVIRAPAVITEAQKITEPVSSIDFTPTLLGILGVKTANLDFDGKDVLARLRQGFPLRKKATAGQDGGQAESMPDRKVYFAGWLEQSPVGFVKGDKKYIYNPVSKAALFFNLAEDPCELNAIPLNEEQADKLGTELFDFRKKSLFKLEKQSGKEWLFDDWKCRWTGRFSSAKLKKE